MSAGIAEAKQELDRLINDFPQTDLKRAGGQRAASSSSRPRPTQRRSEIDVRRKAQQYQRVAELLKTFNEKGDRRPSSRSRSARSSGATSSSRPRTRPWRPTCASSPAGCRPRREGSGKKPLVEVFKAIDEAPDAVRDRFAAWQKAKAEPGGDRRGPVRAGDVGLCRGPRAGRARPEGRRGPLEGTRRSSATISPAPSPRTAASQAAQLEGLDWPAVAGDDRHDPPARAAHPDHPAHAPAAARRRDRDPEQDRCSIASLEDENAEPTEYAVRLPPEYHPLRSYPAIVVLHSGPGPERGDRRVGRRGRRGAAIS